MKKDFIPTWNKFADSERGRKLIAENPRHVVLIGIAFMSGMDAAQETDNSLYFKDLGTEKPVLSMQPPKGLDLSQFKKDTAKKHV